MQAEKTFGLDSMGAPSAQSLLTQRSRHAARTNNRAPILPAATVALVSVGVACSQAWQVRAIELLLQLHQYVSAVGQRISTSSLSVELM